MMHDKDKSCCGRFLLRLTLGILFTGAGLMKIMNPGMIVGMLSQMGFPTATFFGWLLILSEVIFGIAVLVGFRTRLTVWPLIIVLVVAVFTVHLPAWMNGSAGPMGFINFMWHLVGIAGLIAVGISGPGDFAVSKK